MQPPVVLRSPQPVTATDRPRGPRSAAWPLRRVAALVLLAPLTFVLLTAAGGGWSPTTAPAWSALVAVAAVVTAATAATYVPHSGQGWRPAAGCGACSRLAGFSLPASALMLGMSPHDPAFAVLALGIAVVGLGQRVTGGACGVATAPPR